MSTLLIDNYDSYTYNVFHLLASVTGEEPIVVRNDAISWEPLAHWDFDAIVLSPGPGRPERWHDFGVCADVLRRSEVPVLGICLGHQGLGRLLNGTVTTAPVPMHGRLSRVSHDGSGLFAGVPQEFAAVRYHSLMVSGALRPYGRVTAWSEDGVVMGIEHRRRPLWGVQFHPESIASEHGRRILENFYELASRRRPRDARPSSRPPAPAVPAPAPAPGKRSRGLRPTVRTLPYVPCAASLFERLFGDASHAFWLDSADAPTRLARWSYMGTSAGAGRCLLECDVDEGTVTIDRAGERTIEHASIFDVLERELAESGVAPPPRRTGSLLGGFVGYIGYECKADCGSRNVHSSELPDAVLMLADRVVAIDHIRGEMHLIALEDERDRAEDWLDEAERAAARALMDPIAAPPPAQDAADDDEPVSFHTARGRDQYLLDIARCKAALESGESYEICLTDQIATSASPEPFALYRLLRRSNPAPFAAFLKLGEVTILSCSPERFLSVDRAGRVEARPIKGTAPRSTDTARDAQLASALERDEKTYSEHLMIVDLLRNDLGRVCAPDTVRVPELMVVEPYATVHQLTSTITGALEAGRSPVECVRACFPGGSMTGAPKLRTMEIIDDIERVARGVYSGALGYFSLDGHVDLSIVIRTIVMRPGATTIGAGGAIVLQSDAEQEFEELLLKARAPMAAIAEAVTGTSAAHAWSFEDSGPTPALST